VNCRICGNGLTPIVDFGSMPIANDFLTDISRDSYRFNLAAEYCDTCFLLQLSEQPSPTLMFHDHYTFFTGLSSYMEKHFQEMALSNLPINYSPEFMVSEIGCNDGTLLSSIAQLGIRHVGIDPSRNVVRKARLKGVTAEVAFFSEITASEMVSKYCKADLILAANVVCHIPDLNDFAKGIKVFLKEGGKFVFEEPYVGSMIEKVSYDQLYDEHVYMFGSLSVQSIFKRHGLTLVACEPQITHGGSMRYTIMHNNDATISESVGDVIKQEKTLRLDHVNTYLEFGRKCVIRKTELIKLLTDLHAKGKRVAGYAATSKSTTVLNFCKIDSSLIEYISDSTKEKIGTFAPGSHIPIVSHQEMRMNPPDYLVMFAWNHEKEILEKESGLLDSHVKWIRFVPRVEVIE
jgi:methylation protein EvaC